MIEKISLFFILNTYMHEDLRIYCYNFIYNTIIFIYTNKYQFFLEIKNSKEFIVE